jgi:L-lactate dehydrogenase complex protein LldG
MRERQSKGEVLARIRSALLQPVPQPFANLDTRSPIYKTLDEPLDVQFATAFTKLKGQFLYCEDGKDFGSQLRNLADEREWKHVFCWEPRLVDLLSKYDFRKMRIGRDISMADAGITGCEALIARTGSVLLSSRQASGRSLSVFPPVHIVVAYSDQLLPDIEDGLTLMTEKYESSMPSMIALVTGPSRTADIEKTLVLGAHGPKEIFVFLIDKASR